MASERLITEETNSGDLVARVLGEAGIEMVFGISGGHTGRIFRGLEKQQNAIRTVLVREESLGGVMAEVYGRLTRKPGVLIGQGPWVLGNGLLGTLEAHLSSSPMLLLTDFSDPPNLTLHGPYQSATGDYGAWDARTAFRGVTKQVFQALEPASAVQATQLAIKHATTGEPGPVAVIFSLASLSGTVDATSEPRLYATARYLAPPPMGAEASAVNAAAQALLAAKQPVIIAGNGVRIAQAYEQLEQLAGALGLPVVTTASGKGVFAETHPLALGVFGTFGTPAANACVAESDLVLVVGSKLGASDTARENPALLDPARQSFIQIDIEPRKRVVEFSGRPRADWRRRDRARSATRGRVGHGGVRQGRGRGAARRRPSRRARVFRHAGLYLVERADPPTAADRRAAPQLAARGDRHLRRGREPYLDDASVSDATSGRLPASGRLRPDGFRDFRQPSAPSWCIRIGRCWRSAAMAGSPCR